MLLKSLGSMLKRQCTVLKGADSVAVLPVFDNQIWVSNAAEVHSTLLHIGMQYDPDTCSTVLNVFFGDCAEGRGEAEQCTCSEEQTAGSL